MMAKKAVTTAKRPLTARQQKAIQQFNEFVERVFDESFPDWVIDVLSNYDIKTTKEMVEALKEEIDMEIVSQFPDDVVGTRWPTPVEVEERLWMYVRERLGIMEFREPPKKAAKKKKP